MIIKIIIEPKATDTAKVEKVYSDETPHATDTVKVGAPKTTQIYSDTEIEIAKELLNAGWDWLARDESGTLCFYKEKPRKEYEFWNALGSYMSFPIKNIFKSIKWEDNKPTCIEDIIEKKNDTTPNNTTIEEM